MTRLLLAVIVALGALLVLGRLGAGRGDRPEAAAMPEGRPRLFYVLQPGGRLALALAPDVERVKLVALRQLPPASPVEPGARYPFGLVSVLLDHDGREVWRTPAWFESRITRAGQDGPGAASLSRAWLPSGEGLLTDERVIELDLSPLAGAGGELVLEAVAGAVDPVLVRPYRRVLAEKAAGGLFGGAGSEERRRERLAERAGSTLFSELDPREQQALSRFHWRRMAARGARGRDYLATRVILAGYEDGQAGPAAPGSPAGPGIHALRPGRAVALNLAGPAQVLVEVERTGDAGPASAQVVAVSLRGEVERSRLLLGAAARAQTVQAVAAGDIVSLVVANDGQEGLSARVLADDVDGLLQGGTTAVFDHRIGRYLLLPDARVSAMYRTLDAVHAVEYELRGGDGDRVRVEARSVGGLGADLRLEILDGGGEVLSHGRLPCPEGLAAFETARNGGAEEPAGIEAQAELWVGERARRLRLWADRPVDVAVSVPLHDPATDARDQSWAEAPSGARLRFDPGASRRWTHVLPVGAEDLAEAGRQTSLVGQVRFEPTAADLPADLARALGWPVPSPRATEVAWLPEGAPPQGRLLEPWTPEDGAIVPWPAGAWTLLPRERQLALARPAGGSGGEDPRLRLWLDGRDLPVPDATLWSDGRTLARVPLGASAVETTVGPLHGGTPSIRLDSSAASLMALVDWPPARQGDAPGLYRQRTVFRLLRGSPLRARIPVGADGETVLYVLAYREAAPGDAAPSRVAVRVDGGRPAGVPFRRTTPLEVAGPLVAAAGDGGFLADRSGSRLVRAEPIRVPLGDDLGGGLADVTVRLDEGKGLWVRLVASGPDPRRRDAGDQWIERAGPGPDGLTLADPFVHVDSLSEVVRAELADPRGSFRDAPREALDRTRDLGRLLLDVARRGEIAALVPAAEDARALGFDLGFVAAGDGRFLVLRGADAADGRGLLLLRLGAAGGQVLLQAPHAISDIGTEELAARLMERGGAIALQVNSRHRDVAAGPDQAPADLAHRDDTWFFALAQGMLDGLDRPLLAQLHGFGCETVKRPGTDLVLSGGALPCGPCLGALEETAGDLLPWVGVALYPRDVDVLGALTNAQGQAVGGLGRGAFVHLEMSRDLRERLLGDDDALAGLSRAIAAAAEAVGDAEGTQGGEPGDP